MYMIPFCKIFLLLICSVKPECKKKIKKIIFKFEQHFAMRYFPVEHIIPGFLFWIQIPL